MKIEEWFNNRFPFWIYEEAIKNKSCRYIIIKKWKQDKRKGLI